MIIKLITVIIPCFNEDKTIEIIVEKVQKYKSHPLEIIIVDDCSIDNTPLIIQKFVSIYPNIKTFSFLDLLENKSPFLHFKYYLKKMHKSGKIYYPNSFKKVEEIIKKK
jgi:glycosyltransferase involved in cell wall biosynthesis